MLLLSTHKIFSVEPIPIPFSNHSPTYPFPLAVVVVGFSSIVKILGDVFLVLVFLVGDVFVILVFIGDIFDVSIGESGGVDRWLC